jgi:hypothetical protein
MKKIITLLASLAMLVGITACGGGNSNAGYGNYYDSICVNPITQFRVPDYECGLGYHPGWLYYVPYGYHSVGYGVHVVHYNIHLYQRPRNATIHVGGVNPKGGTASHFSRGTTYTNQSGATTTRRPVSVVKNTSNSGTRRTSNQNTSKRSGYGGGGSSRMGSVTRRH